MPEGQRLASVHSNCDCQWRLSATFESVPFRESKPLLSEVSKTHFIEKGGTLETEDSLRLGP